jgi:hypothetical protein
MELLQEAVNVLVLTLAIPLSYVARLSRASPVVVRIHMLERGTI